MSFIDLAKARYSVRKFSDKPIEAEKLSAILEAGKIAPTAKNQQPQKIYVLKSPESVAKINSVCTCIYGAPLVLMIACDRDREYFNTLCPGVHSGETDVAIVTTHMMLEAWELGIGSCWVHRFNHLEVEKLFDLPENERVITLLPLGYAAEDVEPSPRHTEYREFDDMVREL